MTRDERLALIAHHERRSAELRDEIAERQARRLRGEEPFFDTPLPPRPQPPLIYKRHEAPAPEPAVDVPLSLAETLADILGSETGRIERELRVEVATLTAAVAELRADVERLSSANIITIGSRHVA